MDKDLTRAYDINKEDIESIFKVIPLEVLFFLRDNLEDLHTARAHGRLEISVKDGYPSTLHETRSRQIKRLKVQRPAS